MPTYQYHCEKGHDFEEFQSMLDEPIENCPECGAKAIRIITGGAGVIFKGSGFYITDYRKDSYKKDAARDNGTPATKAETPKKTEPKPSTKKD